MNYVFGPVPSWRLGQSLGVDPVPLKTCNWNCVYCQLGRTRPVTTRRDRYVPERVLINQLKTALATTPAREIDWITFVGSGETLLHAQIGCLLREVKTLTEIPVAVITNGSLLCQPYVRWELEVADTVLPSLDAGTSELFRRINRPHRQVLFERYIDGLAAFRQEFDGKIWVEVMLVRNLNDDDRALERIAYQLKRIHPDEIHLNSPTRSPVELWVAPPRGEVVTRARELFKSIAPVRIARASAGRVDLDREVPVEDAVVDVVSRHPLRRDELERALYQLDSCDVRETITQLENSDRLQAVVRGGIEYWVSAATYFPCESLSHTAVGAS